MDKRIHEQEQIEFNKKNGITPQVSKNIKNIFRGILQVPWGFLKMTFLVIILETLEKMLKFAEGLRF